MIRHIVSWKLVASDTQQKSAAFDELAQAFGPLPALIPQIKTLHLGRDLGETSTNWDVVLIMDFEGTSELAEYQAHPDHQPVKEIVRRVTGDRMAVDFEF
jgi:Stress responsive A/B Barrel Domain